MPQNSNSPQHPNEHTLHSNQDDLGPTIVCAPFAGYLTLLVGQGEHVDAGQKLAIVEALKVETLVTARSGWAYYPHRWLIRNWRAAATDYSAGIKPKSPCYSYR